VIPGVETAPTLEVAIEDAELIAILVRHQSLGELEPEKIASATKARVIFDSVNLLDAKTWELSKFQIFRLGASQPEKAVI